MKKLFFTILAAGVLMASGCAGKKAEKAEAVDSVRTALTETVQTVDSEGIVIDNGIIKSANGLPIIVDFSAEWCGPCKQLKPVFDQLKSEYTGKVNFVSIDVDKMEPIATQYGIESIPTLVYITPDGKEVKRTVGLVSGSDIKANLDSLSSTK